jgi:hypothetical protein
MPTPTNNEKRSDFISRCIPKVIDEGTAKSPEQAYAICASMFDKETKTFDWNERNPDYVKQFLKQSS